jgi:type III pantothenate kinase
MLLAIDIGNSSIKCGVFDGEILTAKFSIPTDRNYSAGQISDQIDRRLPASIDTAIVCSVVPEVEDSIAKFINDSFDIEPRFVQSSDDLNLSINFSVETTGADRLVNSFAAAEKYGVPCVVVSFGTATTIDVVSDEKEYLGGLIAPGMKVSADALAVAASKLPETELKIPANVIAQTTEAAIQSGIVNGQIAMVEGLLRQIIEQLMSPPKVVATGGFAGLLASAIEQIEIVDDDLTLNGLAMLNKRLAFRNSE